MLLAVDLGIKTGLAYFDGDGALLWCRSHNFGSLSRLRSGAWTQVRDLPSMGHLVTEGDRRMAEIWAKAGAKRGAEHLHIYAEAWREQLLYKRERQSGGRAKEEAQALAIKVMESAKLGPGRQINHNAAEAVLIGIYGLQRLGFSIKLPR